MTRKTINTIILQEDEIARLVARNKSLERGYLSVCRQNDRLRKRIKNLERDGNELNHVNI